MPESPPWYDAISLSYAPHKATYAIVPMRADCPKPTDEAREGTLDSAVGRMIEDGNV